MIQQKQDGFTIIELLFATAVFASVMLLCLTGITQVGRMYYKGITGARTQESARNVIDEVSRSIQFSGIAPRVIAQPDGTAGVVCVGSSRFTYLLHKQVGDKTAQGQVPHALQRDIVPDTACGDPSVAGVSRVDLVSQGMRLSRFAVTSLDPNNRLWSVSVRVVFGDDDVIECQDGSGNFVDCAAGGADKATAACKGGLIGSQFCGVSELSTVVEKRL